MPLEDDFCDIIKKARLGQARSVEEIAESAHIPAPELEQLERGSRLPSADEISSLSHALNLKTEALMAVVEGWNPQPSPPAVLQSIVTVVGNIGGYEVKGYILYDAGTKQAVLIDTGYNAEGMLTELDNRDLSLIGVCLTHGHTDHAGGLDHILARWPVPVYLGDGDGPLLPWKPPAASLRVPGDRHTITLGTVTVECLLTPGHTPGGICYRVHQPAGHVCFVGDTLFAGSIGRSNPFSLYPTHLESVRQRVLTLPEDSALLPGHGPATTVGEELRYNPFG